MVTVKYLRELAKTYNISGRWKMNKKELMEALHFQDSSPALHKRSGKLNLIKRRQKNQRNVHTKNLSMRINFDKMSTSYDQISKFYIRHRDFFHNRFVNFVEGSSFYPKGSVIWYLRSIPYLKPRKSPTWKNIKCTKLTNSSYIKISPCLIGRSKWIIFFQYAKDLGDYFKKISNKQITKVQHQVLFNQIKKHGIKLTNHNRDVNFLHFKTI